MNTIYAHLDMTRQNFHNRVNYLMFIEMEKQEILKLLPKIREEHPFMSSRIMYKLVQPLYFGRDKFEKLCFSAGYKLKQQKNFVRTTNSLGVTRFLNLIIGIQLTGINKIWVSDITYYRIGDRFYYLTFIMDLYSREIVGYSCSQDLMTESTTLPALRMALAKITKSDLNGLILHSDGGGQYYSKKLLKLTRVYHIKNSMAETVYENAHAERINGTIKNSYLMGYAPSNFAELITMLKRAVNVYNNIRPHSAIGGQVTSSLRKVMKLSTNNELLTKRKKVAKKEKVN